MVLGSLLCVLALERRGREMVLLAGKEKDVNFRKAKPKKTVSGRKKGGQWESATACC